MKYVQISRHAYVQISRHAYDGHLILTVGDVADKQKTNSAMVEYIYVS